MGSLMAGWGSSSIDPKSGTYSNNILYTYALCLSFYFMDNLPFKNLVISYERKRFTVSATLKRNLSLTKNEIDAYWKSKKKIEEEHFRAISNLSETIDQVSYSKSNLYLPFSLLFS